MLRQFLRLHLDVPTFDSDQKDEKVEPNIAPLSNRIVRCMEDSDRMISNIGEPVYLSQPMQLCLPFDNIPSKNGSGLKCTPEKQHILHHRRALDGCASNFSPEICSDSGRLNKSGYWVVRNLGRTKDKRGCSCIGEMDTTSVFAFRDAYAGKSSGQSPRLQSARQSGAGAIPIAPRVTKAPMTVVRYNEPVTLYTNYGVGGRFLSPTVSSVLEGSSTGGARRRLAWQVTEEEIFACATRRKQVRAGRNISRVTTFRDFSVGRISIPNDDDSEEEEEISTLRDASSQIDKQVKWVVRKAGEWPPKPWEDRQACLRRDVICCGDIILLESFHMPGWYIKSRRCNNMLERGAEGAEFQVRAPSLHFAMSLKERTSQYGAAAGQQQGTKKNGFNLLDMNLGIRKSSGHAQNVFFMERKLPHELLRYCISFFAGLLPDYDADYSKKNTLTNHRKQSSIPFSARRDGMTTIRNIRLVCQPWREVANTLIVSVKLGDMCDISTKLQRKQLFQFVLECNNLTKLNLRNLDSIKTSDLEPLRQLSCLHTLNLGGCYSITDRICETVIHLPLVDLNLAMTQITDNSLELFSDHLHYLCDFNVYGCQNITETGLTRLVMKLPLLSQLNLRGTNISTQQAAGLRILCKSECEILTGPARDTSLFNRRSIAAK